MDVLRAAHQPDHMVARLLEELADVEKGCPHQKSVLQHHNVMIDLDEGDARFAVMGDRHVAVFRRKEALPLRFPFFLRALLQLFAAEQVK